MVWRLLAEKIHHLCRNLRSVNPLCHVGWRIGRRIISAFGCASLINRSEADVLIEMTNRSFSNPRNQPRHDMSFFNDLLEKPANLSTASKYSVMNGFIYLGAGALLIVWPGAVQTLFRDDEFAGH